MHGGPTEALGGKEGSQAVERGSREREEGRLKLAMVVRVWCKSPRRANRPHHALPSIFPRAFVFFFLSFPEHCQTSPRFSWPHFHRIFFSLQAFLCSPNIACDGVGPGVWCRGIRDDFGMLLSAGDGKLEFGVDCSV